MQDSGGSGGSETDTRRVRVWDSRPLPRQCNGACRQPHTNTTAQLTLLRHVEHLNPVVKDVLPQVEQVVPVARGWKAVCMRMHMSQLVSGGRKSRSSKPHARAHTHTLPSPSCQLTRLSCPSS